MRLKVDRDISSWTIKEHYDACESGENPFAICRLKSGWLMLGFSQSVPGYFVFASKTFKRSVFDLSKEEYEQFHADILKISEMLKSNLEDCYLVNVSYLGNSDPYAHAHIQARYSWEEPGKRESIVSINYKTEPMPFEISEEFQILMIKIKRSLSSGDISLLGKRVLRRRLIFGSLRLSRRAFDV